MRSVGMALIIVALATMLLPGASMGQTSSGAFATPALEYVEGEVLVKFRGDVAVASDEGTVTTGLATLDAVLQRYQVTAAEPLFATVSASPFGLEAIYKLRLAAGVDVLQAVGDLSLDANVEYAEPNFLFRLPEPQPAEAPAAAAAANDDDGAALTATTPDDTLYEYQWGLFNSGQTGGRNGAHIEAPEAWDLEKGSSDVVLAVVDTGVDYTHEDLNDGRVIAGRDFINNDSDAMDDHGHGTHVAGTIAAETNNGTGVSGVMWEARIMPVKVLDRRGSGSSDAVANGIQYAADNGADVINLSLGSFSCSSTIADVINYAYFEQGVILVAAAGNNGGSIGYPAKYPPVIAIGASNNRDERAGFSSYGDELDVVAPGVTVLSTVPLNGYDAFSGTSMASPHAAGVLGLLLSWNPRLTQEQARAVLQLSADDLGQTGFDRQYGHGRINIFSALQQRTPDDAPVPEQAECLLCSVSFTAVNSASGSNDLDSLWTFRDEVLRPSPVGQQFDQLFYDHTLEVTGLLLRNPKLLSASQDNLDLIMPVVRELTGEGPATTITAEQVRQMQQFQQALAAEASPELSSLLQSEWEQANPEQFIGMTASEAWETLQQQQGEQVYLPLVVK